MHKRVVFFSVIFFSLLLAGFSYALVFSDTTSGNFNNGTYVNATYNGTGVVLADSNISGSFTSRIFDATSPARLNSLSWQGSLPSRDDIVAADVAADVWVSIDSGANWTKVNDDYNGATGNGGTDMAVNSSGGLFILHNQDLWSSTNGGTSWTLVTSDFNPADANNGIRLVVDPSNTLFAVDGSEDVWKSTNGGTTFTKVATDFNGGSGNFFGLVSNQSGALFATDSAADVWVSIDSGANWTKVNDDYNGAIANGGNDMAINRTGSLFIGDGQDLWSSTNGGTTWTLINTDYNNGDTQGVITFAIDSSNTFVILESDEDVWKSTNGGTTFTKVATNINGATGNLFGISPLTRQTNLTFQVRNCSLSCTNEGFVGPDGTPATYFSGFNATVNNLTGRYFQYRAYLEGHSNLSPLLTAVNLSYVLLDTTPPVISILSPQNRTYNSSSLFLNYTATDDLALGTCNYSIDGSTIALPGCSTASISGLSEGGHLVIVSANDSAGNSNSSRVSFSVDTRAPIWSGLVSSTPLTYSASQLSFFNVSWSDASAGLQMVWFESNFSGESRNYSMYPLSGNAYGFNVSLPAGTFFWKSYANDSVGNVNMTSSQIVTVGVAANPLLLTLNGNQSNLTISYGTQSNATATALFGSPVLHRNSLVVSNPEIAVLGANVNGYRYTANVSGTQNYSANASEFFLFVTKQNLSASLTLNGFASDLTVLYGNQSTVISSESNEGDADVVYSLSRNGALLGEGSSLSDEQTLGVGTYVYSYTSLGGENYTNLNRTRTLTINARTPSLSLLVNGQSLNASQTYGAVSNATAVIDDSLGVDLFRNGVLVSSGTHLVSDVSVLAAGTYNYTASFPGNENYTRVSSTLFLSNTRASPSILLTLNGASSDVSLPLGSVLSVNATLLTPSSESLSLYEDGSLVSSGTSVSTNVNYSSLGTRVWLASFPGNENYTSQNSSLSASILDSSSPQFSSISVSPTSPASYSSGATYTFSITWTDNLAIDDVIFEFDGVNHSYRSSGLNRLGDVYSFSIVDLAARNYSYRWFANDSSNSVTATSVRTYIISKASVPLVFSFSPTSIVEYGSAVTASCVASTTQMVPSLTRNSVSVSNPDNPSLAAGVYLYVCSAPESQNYTSTSSSSFLTITRTSPAFELLLNGAGADVSLPADGGSVNISASVVRPAGAGINLSVSGVVVNSTQGLAEQTVLFSGAGDYPVQVSFFGNENYTSGFLSRTVHVSSSTSSSGGGGGGGGGSGGGGTVQGGLRGPASLSLDISPLNLRPGVPSEYRLAVRNNGTRFLNQCSLSASRAASAWFSAEGAHSLSSGQEVVYTFSLEAPFGTEPETYDLLLEVNCEEVQSTRVVPVSVSRSDFDFIFVGSQRNSVDSLEVEYRISERLGSDQSLSIDYSLLNSDSIVIASGRELISIDAGEDSVRSFVIQLPKDSFGEFSLSLSVSNGEDVFSSEEAVFLSSSGISGFAISGDNRRTLSTFVSVIILAAVAFFIGRFFYKRLQLAHYHPPRSRFIKLGSSS